MSWGSIIGQTRAISLLKGMIGSGRIAHAYLFSGPEGSGQEAAALEFARALLCDQGGTEACENCRSCLKSRTLQHPNLKLIMPLPVGRNERYGDPPFSKLSEGDLETIRAQLKKKAEDPYHTISIPKSNAIKINSVREIRKEASLTGFEGGRKVFVILEAERLNEESSNALLKTLEEPPGDTVLLLATDSADLLLPTIVSRCQELRLAPLSVGEISSALQTRAGLPAADALLAAQVSNGSYTRALSTIRSGLQERRAEAVDFLRAALTASPADLMRSIDLIGQRYQKSELEDFLSLLREWLREAMMLSAGVDSPRGPEPPEELRRFVDRYGGMNLLSAEGAIERAVSLVGKNVYIPLILLNLALSLREAIIPPEQPDLRAPLRGSAGAS